ncbi:MAG TPA: LysM peptidoglycan-binding domain-containing protein [Gemmatimonadales bacterium]|nr:LysM peptidoglycan-binding domain-containing protein [Gemmatimonadales bacterium]
MRRTTICRSNRAALLALVAVPLVCGTLRGQDTTRAAPDTSRAAIPAVPSTESPALAQVPATHTVVRGETLWSISQQYFTDPLLWPEIYRLNISSIEDPHWIYPGQVLTISGQGQGAVAQTTPAETTAVAVTPALTGDTVRAQAVPTDTAVVAAVPTDTTTTPPVEEPPPPPASEAYQTIFDRPASHVEQPADVLRAYANQPYRPLRRGEFYSAGFLTEGEHLPWGQVIGRVDQPAIPRLSTQSVAYQYDQIVIEPPARTSYHVGDSILIARIDRNEGNWGDVVVPVGVARVRDVTKKQLLAEILLQFGRIRDGRVALPLEPFKDPGEVRPTPVKQGLQGHIIAHRDLHALGLTQQILFIDRGRADGVSPGDVFEAYTGELGSPSQEPRAYLEIVHTRQHSSSGLLLNIENPLLKPGLDVRLIRKMPS